MTLYVNGLPADVLELVDGDGAPLPTVPATDREESDAAAKVTVNAGGGSQPLDPTTIPGLGLWLDASQIIGLGDGDPVASWADESGNGRDAVQADETKQPTYVANALNAKPIVRFGGDGSGGDPFHWLALGSGLDLLQDVPGLTICAVFQNITTSNDYLFNASSGTEPTLRRAGFEPALGQVNQCHASNDDEQEILVEVDANIAPTSGSAVPTGCPLSSVVAIDLARGSLGWECGSAGNPNEFSLQDWNAALANTPDTPSLSITVGSLSAESGDEGNFNGDIAELLIYQRALNLQERRQLIEYLSAKWDTL